MKEYVKVPVLVGFNTDIQIGTLEVLKSSLPSTPEFVFTIGYKTAEGDKPFELKAVSISTDTEFLAYLKEQGAA
jgi:hypothetical protein